MDHRIILPPEQDHFERYYHYPRVFSPPECDAIIQTAERNGFHPGSIGIGVNQQPRIDTDYRMVGCAQITAEQMPWLFDKVRERCEWVNQAWKFDLHGLYEEIGIMKYESAAPDAPAGHYNWHQDFGGGPYSRRKISIVSLLSEPADFDGGELRCFADQGEHRASLNERGDMVLFPSWLPHCVMPVITGTRYSLVAWVSGPRFR